MFTQDPITLRWKPGGGFYQLRIRPSVTAPAMCEAYGPGLRGAITDVTTSIHIVAKDNLGNPRDETGAEQVGPLSRRTPRSPSRPPSSYLGSNGTLK
jgi:hypothetical protein